MIYTMKSLACDPQRVKGMSERLIISHYENNYGGAVKRLNQIAEQFAGLDVATAPNFVINGLKREELVATNSMVLHELFFAGLGEESGPGPKLTDALADSFGSMERWRAEFEAMGKAQGGGSGWVLLTWSPRDRRLVNQWAADHTTTLAGGQPILALDMLRALLPHRLRRQGRRLCRDLHAGDPMGERRRTVRPTLQAGLICNGKACDRFAGNTPQIRSYQ